MSKNPKPKPAPKPAPEENDAGPRWADSPDKG